MLTSFFGKSTPLNFLLVGLYTLLLAALQFVIPNRFEFTTTPILNTLLVLIVTVLVILLLDFVIRKNGLTQLNTYAIFVFACFVLASQALWSHPRIIISVFALLMAYRRICSLPSPKNRERKILDATLWIVVASAFYFWSLLFLFALYFAIFSIPKFDLRKYLIPPAGLLASALVFWAYFILTGANENWISDWVESYSFDFSAYGNRQSLIVITLLMTLLIWSVGRKLMILSKVKRRERPNQWLLLLVVIVSAAITLLAPDKNGSELSFLIMPQPL